MQRFRFYTDLPPFACVERVKAAIDSEWSPMFSLVAFTGRKAIAGKAAGATIRLRKRIGYSNSFQPILTATLSADGAGTLLHGRIGLHPAVVAFMTVWFAGVILIGGSVFLTTLSEVVASSTSPQGDVWVGLAVPPAMLLFGYALIRFGRHLAADEGALLADFLAKTVEARFQSEST